MLSCLDFTCISFYFTTTDECKLKTEELATAYHWLGLKLLIELRDLFTLPIPAPHGLLEEAATHLTAPEQTELTFIIDDFIQELKQALHGRDAFQPAQTAVAPAILTQVTQAIETDTPLTIAYQALGDRKASYRQI